MLTTSAYILYPLLGILVAAFGTLIGAGGGIIFVPLFLFLFDWPPAAIVGTSLTIVFCNALSGSFAYMRQGKVRYDAAWLFAAATVPGAVSGALLADHFSGSTFKLSFGSFLAALALFMLWKNARHKGAIEESAGMDFTYSKTRGALISTAVGFISSIFGIGGGVIHVPAMIYLLGFPTHVATATSHFVLALSAFIGVVTHAVQGHVYWPQALLFGAGALVGAQVGALLAKHVRAKLILQMLAVALLLLGLRLIILR
ncbi:MAG: sulfite exporter TauE/SafE family protein [Veillonellaceae bacterium]|nr:sulfite exporter TauE/SafE family protein [Veillonellaceae bacterium]